MLIVAVDRDRPGLAAPISTPSRAAAAGSPEYTVLSGNRGGAKHWMNMIHPTLSRRVKDR